MTNYGRQTFIRAGWGSKAIKTGTLSEAVVPGTVINVSDMSQYDAGDRHLGIALNTFDWDVNVASNLPTTEPIYYVDLHAPGASECEVLVTEANSGATADGDLLAATTAGEIIKWAYTNTAEATDTLEAVVGTSVGIIAKDGSGFMTCHQR